MKWKNLSENLIREAISNNPSLEGVCKQLNLANGPNTRKKIKEFVAFHQVDITHFDRGWYAKKVKKHFKIKRNCLQCKNEFETYDSGKNSHLTCSKRCSSKYFFNKRMTESARQKLSVALHKFHKTDPNKKEYVKICPSCEKEFNTKNKNTKTCSRTCAHKLGNTVESRKKISESIRKRVRIGEHKGWQTRNISSYAENYFKWRLTELNLKYEFNFPVPKQTLGIKENSCYFLDFYFPDLKLDLEIDGKQHDQPDRMKSDQIRDNLLNKIGIKVFRIKWKNLNSPETKKQLEDQLQTFLKFIDSDSA